LSARDTGIPACSSAPGAPPEEAGRNAYITSLLTRLVALNHERAAEEKRGLIRYLRPEYQNPTAAAPQPVQTTLAGTEAPSSQSKIPNPQSSIDNPSSPLPWPDRLPCLLGRFGGNVPVIADRYCWDF